MTRQIILIGGIPTAGKSTIAKNLSEQLGLPWISTDQIGSIMRAATTKEDNPKLFMWEDYGGFQYLSKLTAEEIANNEFAKGEAVWSGVRKFITEDFVWSNGFIIEGDDILPHLVNRDFSNSSDIKVVFIGDQDTERVRNVVFTRNFKKEDVDVYPDSVKEKEVKWILKYSERLESQVLKYKMPWVEVEKNEHDLDKVLGALELG